MSPSLEKLLRQLRSVDDAHRSLSQAISDLEVEPPSLYHSTLLALAAKRGVLQGMIDESAREPLIPYLSVTRTN